MNDDELIEKTRRAFEAWSSGDPGLLAAELADDVEWIFPGDSALAGTKRGRDEVFEHWGVFGPKLRGAQWRHYLSDGELALGNMFQFKRDFAADYAGARDLDRARALNPELQTLDDWLADNAGRIPLGNPDEETA